MTRDDIIALARELWPGPLDLLDIDVDRLHALAEVATRRERERCCRVVYGHCGSDNDAERIVAAIRQ